MVSACCGFRADWHNSLRRLATTRMQAIVSSALMMKPSRSFRRSSLLLVRTQAVVVLGWEPVRWFSAELAYSVFAPGRFITDMGPSKTAHFVGLETVVKF